MILAAPLGRGVLLLLLFFAALLPARPAAATQLAQSFYNVTAIRTRTLPNAVQITIQTDGTLQFGVDLAELYDDENRSAPRSVTSFRLRLLRARARLPAFVEIGAFPADAAVVTLGADEFGAPFFGENNDPAATATTEPRVDIQLRFFVPVTVGRLNLDVPNENNEDDNDEPAPLGPNEVEIRLGSDRRSVVVTVISPRVDAGGAARLRRQKPADQKRRLQVALEAASDRLRIDVLHTPLADVLDAVSRAGRVPLIARADAAEIDVSLFLPRATIPEFLQTLAVGYGVVWQQENNGMAAGRGGTPTVTERLPLRHLSPERARLLFPDFLLRALRVDTENNALIASGSPLLIARLRADLLLLDLPRAQVRVEAQAFEVSSSTDLSALLRASRTTSQDSAALDGGAGTLSVRVADDQKRAFTATLEALIARGQARLAARPFLTIASGETGTLFLGQSRFVPVLRLRRGVQEVQALRLAIGYSLTVSPVVGARDDITLEISPRVSTVDEIEARTGLPTLGIREVSASVRVRPGDQVLIAGLDVENETKTRRRLGGLIGRIPIVGTLLSRVLGGSRRASQSQTKLIVLVSATKVS